MRKRRVIIVLIVCAFLLICAVTPMGIYLRMQYDRGVGELKLKHCRNQMEDAFSKQTAQFEAVANDVMDSEEVPYYNKWGNYENLTPDMEAAIIALQKECSVVLDEIYRTTEIHREYPADACVFSATVMLGDEVYAWVEIVYTQSPVEPLFTNYQEAQAAGVIQELSENWYLMTHYGY